MGATLDALRELHPVCQALLAGLFTWSVTALGAALVFFTRAVNQKLLDMMLGLSGGVMIAASYWSLLAPAIEISENQGGSAWLPAAVGFLSGGIVLLLLSYFGSKMILEVLLDRSWHS